MDLKQLPNMVSQIINFFRIWTNYQIWWAHWTPSAFDYSTPLSSLDTIQSSIFNSSELIGHPPEFNIQVCELNGRTLEFNNGHPLEFNIQLQWAQWTPSGLQYSTYRELNGHTSKFNIQLRSAQWTPSGLQYSTYRELNGHTPKFNIQLRWAHWTPFRVQYSTTVSLLDTLWISILNYSELIRHPPEFNIQLWWAHWTPSTFQY